MMNLTTNSTKKPIKWPKLSNTTVEPGYFWLLESLPLISVHLSYLMLFIICVIKFAKRMHFLNKEDLIHVTIQLFLPAIAHFLVVLFNLGVVIQLISPYGFELREKAAGMFMTYIGMMAVNRFISYSTMSVPLFVTFLIFQRKFQFLKNRYLSYAIFITIQASCVAILVIIPGPRYERCPVIALLDRNKENRLVLLISSVFLYATTLIMVISMKFVYFSTKTDKTKEFLIIFQHFPIVLYGLLRMLAASFVLIQNYILLYSDKNGSLFIASRYILCELPPYIGFFILISFLIGNSEVVHNFLKLPYKLKAASNSVYAETFKNPLGEAPAA